MNAMLEWAPFLPLPVLFGLCAAALGLFAVAWFRRAADFYWRGAFFVLLAALLWNPVILTENRQSLPDKVLVVVDDSPSQNIAKRNAAAEKALEHIKSSLAGLPGIEPVIVHGGADAASQRNQNTSLFGALKNSLSGVPAGQVAGTIFITDGQVHDVPEVLGALEKLGPFHAVLTGKKDEFDRRVTVVEAPKYGLLGQDVHIKVRVDGVSGQPALLKVRQDGKEAGEYTVGVGEAEDYSFTLDHPGQSVFEFSIAAEKGELTDINNTAAVLVNGIRDRLRVLLVSGMPHVGERAWRDLLKSDPSIDLVHFTILRSPMSFDNTPTKEMSLIAFPVDELFERKIREFDLIIFDKYAQYGLLQPQYFVNIAAFVKQGGAFLMAMGSDAAEQSLFRTAVGDILPVLPKMEDQSILSGAYVPQLTDLGKAHPVTGDLQKSKQGWSRWFTQVDIQQTGGKALMTGIDGKPLLILDSVGDGRVAVLTSDNIWLWSKGVDGGGPYTDLLRHVAHWLMKEPELEEDYIRAETKGDVITVSRRDLGPEEKRVKMAKPDGKEEEISLQTKESGWTSAKVIADLHGIYRFSSGERTAFAVVGAGLSEEFTDVRTTEEKLKPLVDKTKGAMIWAPETPDFTFRRDASGRFGGKDWIGLKENDAYTVRSVESRALVPGWLALLIVFGGLVFVWWREGGKKRV